MEPPRWEAPAGSRTRVYRTLGAAGLHVEPPPTGRGVHHTADGVTPDGVRGLLHHTSHPDRDGVSARLHLAPARPWRWSRELRAFEELCRVLDESCHRLNPFPSDPSGS